MSASSTGSLLSSITSMIGVEAREDQVRSLTIAREREQSNHQQQNAHADRVEDS